MSALLAIILFRTVYLIPSFNAYKIKVSVETAVDGGNEDTDVYLTLMDPDNQTISEEKRLGKFEEGVVREFEFITNSLDLECLIFSLKEGTDGWIMEKSTVVLESGVTYTYTNLRKEKLENTFWFHENSVKFCTRNIAAFELIDKYARTVEDQHEGLLLFDGGTVCDDEFGDFSAESICIAMGRPHSNVTWTSYKHIYIYLYGAVQSRKTINLDRVRCQTSEWYQCSFTTVHECKHYEDIFLTCGDSTTTVVSTTVDSTTTAAKLTAKSPDWPLVLIICIASVTPVSGIILLIIRCVQWRKRATEEQSRPHLQTPFTPDVERPSSSAPSAPSAPPAYDHEMTPTAGGEASPSYDEVVASPNRFKSVTVTRILNT
ncbi:uncharacterized protein LOC134814490 isoform X2 [Bolinopsis microptera]|uniref:uncharacterized protein LOC134814490 isoform X2 n=1 Tax=Bolinopsis microptera TaxID=2820187 RepID=UPI003079886B